MLPPPPTVMPPAPPLRVPRADGAAERNNTEAAPVEPAGLNWVFDPQPARAFEGGQPHPLGGTNTPKASPIVGPPPPAMPMPGPPLSGPPMPGPPKMGSPLAPLMGDPAAAPSPPGPPAAAWPAVNNPSFSPPNGAPAIDGSFGPDVVYSLAPSAGKRWRTPLMILAFMVVAGGVAAVVALVAAREAPPPAPTQLEVISIPPGAQVTVDGKRTGVTPLPLDKVEPGKTYKLIVELAKYERWERQVVTERGRTVKVIAALKPILGVLRVDSTPQGAEVYLGPQSQPIGRTPLTKENMDPFDDVDVEVRLKGYRPDRQRVHWGGLREQSVSFRMVASP